MSDVFLLIFELNENVVDSLDSLPIYFYYLPSITFPHLSAYNVKEKSSIKDVEV